MNSEDKLALPKEFSNKKEKSAKKMKKD